MQAEHGRNDAKASIEIWEQVMEPFSLKFVCSKGPPVTRAHDARYYSCVSALDTFPVLVVFIVISGPRGKLVVGHTPAELLLAVHIFFQATFGPTTVSDADPSKTIPMVFNLHSLR